MAARILLPPNNATARRASTFIRALTEEEARKVMAGPTRLFINAAGDVEIEEIPPREFYMHPADERLDVLAGVTREGGIAPPPPPPAVVDAPEPAERRFQWSIEPTYNDKGKQEGVRIIGPPIATLSRQDARKLAEAILETAGDGFLRPGVFVERKGNVVTFVGTLFDKRWPSAP